MTETLSLPQLNDLLNLAGVEISGGNLLLIGLSVDSGVESLSFDVQTVAARARVPADARADVALLTDDIPDNAKPAFIHDLARLRDLHSRALILLSRNERLTENELRGLGFISRGESGIGTVLVYDPDESNPPREWNNADHWANPENFSRFRW